MSDHQPCPRSEWPAWALWLAERRQEGERGVGDTVALERIHEVWRTAHDVVMMPVVEHVKKTRTPATGRTKTKTYN